MTKLSLKEVIDEGLCTGCGLCVAMSPTDATMKFNANGFLRPHFEVPLSPEIDKEISYLCPGYSLDLQQTEGQMDDIWGPIIASRQGHAIDAKVRFQGSSGGVLTALSNYLLASGAVDGVVQIRSAAKDPTQNEVYLSRTPEDTLESAGSRYAPSSPVEALNQYLNQDGTFAVIGKPCDIAAIRQWMRIDKKVGIKFPYLLSFFCAGVPSRRGAHEVVSQLGMDLKDLGTFRYRGNGWPGSATAESKAGESRSMSYAKSWGEILSHHVQFRCKICPDGTGEFADIVCADAWECDESGYPLFNEQEGQSVVLSRTQVGEQLIQKAVSVGVISLQDLAISALGSMQPGQLGRKRRVLARLLAMRFALRSVPRFDGFRLFKSARMTSLQDNITNFLGTLKRILLRQDLS